MFNDIYQNGEHFVKAKIQKKKRQDGKSKIITKKKLTFLKSFRNLRKQENARLVVNYSVINEEFARNRESKNAICYYIC